jgi:hypothetical protein
VLGVCRGSVGQLATRVSPCCRDGAASWSRFSQTWDPDRAERSGYARRVEIFYIGLLVAVALLVTWFALYVVYRLLHEDK